MWRPYKQLLSPALFILLTAVAPVAPGAQDACEPLFGGHASDPVPPQRRLQVGALQTRLKELRSPEEFKNLIDELVQAENSLNRESRAALMKVSLIPTLRSLRARAPDSPIWQEIANFIDGARAKDQGAPENFKKVVTWLEPVLLELRPETLMRFIEDLPQYAEQRLLMKTLFSGTYGLSAAGPGLSDVLSALTPEMRTRVLSELKKQFSAIDLDAEKMMGSDSVAKANALRVHRRNLEIIIHLVLRSELKPVRDAMKSGDVQNTMRALDNYYSLLHQMVGPKRGGYTQDIVLKSARIVREHLAPHLADEWVDLYGSWTNGKAALRTSDVDLKISSKLLGSLMGRSTWDLQGAPVHLYFAEVVANEGTRASPRLLSFWQAYQNAEDALAQDVFKRRVEKPSELLSALYPPKPYPNDATDMRWYNPLTVRIYQNRIELRFDDLIAGDSESLVIEEFSPPTDSKGWNWKSLLKWPSK